MIAPEFALPLVIGLPLIAGTALAVVAGRRSGVAAAWALGAVTAAALALVLVALPGVLAGEAVAASWHWVPELGLNVSLRLDGLAALFAILILAIGLLVILYARYYLGRRATRPGRFYGQLALFMAAMLGVALADNLLAPRGVLGADERRLVPADRLLAHRGPTRARARAWRSRSPPPAASRCSPASS